MLPCKNKKFVKLVPPDGGWGWMVLFGIAISNIFNMSLLSVFSLLYGDALEAMGHKTQGAALVLNTASFISILAGPIAGGMVKLTSPRLVAVTGACLCTVAVFLSGFSTNIWHFVITFGIILGFGLDLVTVASFVAINSYFNLKKGRALGLAMIGTSVGQTLMPHLIRYLLEHYEFRGACLLLSSLSIQGVAGCLLIQPVEQHLKTIETYEPIVDDSKQINEDSDNIVNEIIQSHTGLLETGDAFIKSYASIPILCRTAYANELHSINEDDDSSMKSFMSDSESSLVKTAYDLCGVSLLNNMTFINILVGLALASSSIQNFSMLYPFFLEKEISLDKRQIANCMSVVAIADIAGRFILPIFQDKYKIKARWILIVTCFWLIAIRQIMAYQSNLAVIITMSACYGFGRSMIIVQRNLAISENCEMDQVPVAVGLGKFATGFFALPLGYLLAWIRDYTGSYIACLTAQNALLVLVVVTWVPDLLYKYSKEI